MKVKTGLKELTKDLYLKYKRAKFQDRQIARLFSVSPNTLTKWKKENGIPIGLHMGSLKALETLFPEDLEKTKKKFIQLEKRGWKLVHIGEELKMSEVQISKFTKKHFPEKRIKERYYLTDEEAATAKENGLSRKLVSRRRHVGWTVEQAISIPKGLTKDGRNKYDVMWESRKNERCENGGN